MAVYPLNHVGRYFTIRELKEYRIAHIVALEKKGRTLLATSYRHMTLIQYAAYNGKVIVKRSTQKRQR